MAELALGNMRGAYGLALPDLVDARHLLVESSNWPTWRITHRKPRVGELERQNEILNAERAHLRLSKGFVELSRIDRSSALVLPSRPGDAEIVHPLLSLTAATAALWRNWLAFHAGGLVSNGEAWGVIGPKGAGKSTFMAWYADQGNGSVLADDVLIVDDSGQALCGPRCLDLRRSAAERFGPTEYLGVVGARERWRLRLGDAPIGVPLRGWIQLEWGDRTEAQPLSAHETFAAITDNLALRVMPPNAGDLLAMAALPGWRLTRPARFEAMDDIRSALSRILESGPNPRAVP